MYIRIVDITYIYIYIYTYICMHKFASACSARAAPRRTRTAITANNSGQAKPGQTK